MSKIDQKFKNAVDRIDSEHSKLTLRTLIDNAQNVDELEYCGKRSQTLQTLQTLQMGV